MKVTSFVLIKTLLHKVTYRFSFVCLSASDIDFDKFNGKQLAIAFSKNKYLEITKTF